MLVAWATLLMLSPLSIRRVGECAGAVPYDDIAALY